LNQRRGLKRQKKILNTAALISAKYAEKTEVQVAHMKQKRRTTFAEKFDKKFDENGEYVAECSKVVLIIIDHKVLPLMERKQKPSRIEFGTHRCANMRCRKCRGKQHIKWKSVRRQMLQRRQIESFIIHSRFGAG